MIRHFRYISFAFMPLALKAGWLPTDALVGSHHGNYAVLCEWVCACPEAWPLSLADG